MVAVRYGKRLEGYQTSYSHDLNQPLSGRLYLAGKSKLNPRVNSNSNMLSGRLYLAGGVDLSGSKFSDFMHKAKDTIKNVTTKGYDVFKKVYKPVSKVLKSDIVKSIASSINPGISKAIDIGTSIIDSGIKSIDDRNIKELTNNPNFQELVEIGKNKAKNYLEHIKKTNPDDYDRAAGIYHNIDWSRLRRKMKNKDKLLDELVNQILIDPQLKTNKSGSLKLNKRYRKMFGIKSNSVRPMLTNNEVLFKRDVLASKTKQNILNVPKSSSSKFDDILKLIQ